MKKNDDGDNVSYTYGYETQDQTGELAYRRKDETATVIRPAKNDDRPKKILAYMRKIVIDENAPAVRQVATG